MTEPLKGKSIAVLESRELEELTRLLRKEGADTVPVPMVAIHDQPDEGPVLAWLRELVDGRFETLVAMTGEGLRRLHGFASRAGMAEEYVVALGESDLIVRGPKPARALKELGVAGYSTSPSPTSDGVIEALGQRQLNGKVVGLQSFEEADERLEQHIRDAGAEPRVVLPYVYRPDCSDEDVLGLIRDLGDGAVDVVAVTSSPQVSRLFAVAEAHGKVPQLTAALGKACVAAVGPVAEAGLRSRGVRVDVCPERGGFVMKKLVEYLKRYFSADGEGEG